MFEVLLASSIWIFVAYIGFGLALLIIAIAAAVVALIVPPLREPLSRLLSFLWAMMGKIEHVAIVIFVGGGSFAVAYGMVAPEIRSALLWDKISARIVDRDAPCKDGSLCDNFHLDTSIVIVEWRTDTGVVERHQINDTYSGLGGLGANDFHKFQRGDSVTLRAPRDNPALARKPMNIGWLLFHFAWCALAFAFVYWMLRTPLGTHRDRIQKLREQDRESA